MTENENNFLNNNENPTEPPVSYDYEPTSVPTSENKAIKISLLI